MNVVRIFPHLRSQGKGNRLIISKLKLLEISNFTALTLWLRVLLFCFLINNRPVCFGWLSNEPSLCGKLPTVNPTKFDFISKHFSFRKTSTLDKAVQVEDKFSQLTFEVKLILQWQGWNQIVTGERKQKKKARRICVQWDAVRQLGRQWSVRTTVEVDHLLSSVSLLFSSSSPSWLQLSHLSVQFSLGSDRKDFLPPKKIVTKMLKRIFEFFFFKWFKLTRLFKAINSRPFEFELVDRWVVGQLLIEWTKFRGKTFSDLNARLISSFKKRTRFVTFSCRSPSWTISF